MTCFWDGIIRSLNKKDYEMLGITKHGNHMENIKNVIISFKNKSQNHNFEMEWQGVKLREKEVEEIKEAIKDYNINGIRQGHLTSICDPFLCFISSYLKHKIQFKYMSNNLIYSPVDNTKIRKEVNYSANRGHFQFINLREIR